MDSHTSIGIEKICLLVFAILKKIKEVETYEWAETAQIGIRYDHYNSSYPAEFPVLANEAIQAPSKDSKRKNSSSPWVCFQSSLQSYILCSSTWNMHKCLFFSFITMC